VRPTEFYLRGRAGEDQAAADAARVAAIGAALGLEFELLADVAMGEPVGEFPTPPALEPAAVAAAAAKKAEKAANAAATQAGQGQPAKEDKVKVLEWYGFVRLQVWARRRTAAGAKLCADWAAGNVATLVVPIGDKVTGNAWAAANCRSANDSSSANGSNSGIGGNSGTNSNIGYSAAGQAYAAGLSPDKGVVLAYFPTAGLLCCAAHFHGTNKHGVPERVFDAVRRQQLMRAGEAAAWLVGAHSKDCKGVRGDDAAAAAVVAGRGAQLGCGLVLAGDLNFRLESEFVSPGDKQQGGKDFQTVLALATGDVSVLKGLFLRHDRLHKLLVTADACDSAGEDVGNGVAASSLPPLVTGVFDALGASVVAADASDKPPLRPTLTYKPGAPPPRPYETKRAPSWADRVLTRDLACFLGAPATLVVCKSLPQVVCSDHEPVVAIFST
jgi:hypothetical protein